MRLHIGDLPPSKHPGFDDQGWTLVEGPKSSFAHLFAGFVGIVLLTFVLLALMGISLISSPNGDTGPSSDTSPWPAVILGSLLSIPAHELVHAFFYPDHGTSQATVLSIWPRKLRFGVFFEGTIARSRWLLMRLAPLAILSFGPALVLVLTSGMRLNFAFETFLSVLILINTLGSGGDIVAAAWVLSHIPAGARMGFAGGKAYWTLSHHQTLKEPP